MSYFEQTKITDSSGTLINPVQDESVILLRRITKLLEASATADSSQRQRVVVEGTATTSGSISTVTTVTSMTGLAGVDARYLFIDTARNTYANGIRTNLTW